MGHAKRAGEVKNTKRNRGQSVAGVPAASQVTEALHCREALPISASVSSSHCGETRDYTVKA
jgi:hypothetical protein